MKHQKNKLIATSVIVLLFATSITHVNSEDAKQAPEVKDKKRGFFSFLHREDKQVQDFIEKQKKELEDFKKKREEEKTKEKNIEKKTLEETTKNQFIAKEEIDKRNKEIQKAKHTDKVVEVYTSEEDPLYILEAEVLDTKTKFLKLRNVDFKYKLRIQNQTPKIISSALIIWERKIPFTESLTINKETKISKPIIPYEKRLVEYNDIDSKRQGETYRVKIAKVTFEDGTQWKNPILYKMGSRDN
ncbi:MAG: hypothetical protein HY094_05510 [Candidatus Melainabacteria bacterium]|nr:hypothetical protein [Candidatus Melainabacteria bacterium]